MKLQALLCFFLVSQGSAYRKITSSLNPGCDECGETVVVVKAVGDYDILYQVWDFSRGIPTIIAFIAGLNSNLSIKWNKSVPTRFDLSELPKYTMAVALDSIIEYDDTEDKAAFDPKYRHRFISLNDYYWARTAALIGVDDDAMVIMHYIRDVTPRKRTTIEVRLESSTTSITSVLLPHLLFTNNATIIDITLSDMPTHESYKHSRFAFHFVLLCNGNSTDTMHYFEERTLDDEHAPGVFKMIYFKTPESFSSNFSNGGYIQFRPVAYREYKRSFASSTGIKVSPFNSARVPPRSTMDVFFSNVTFPPNQTLVQDVIISFGDPGDGFYNKYNVTAWEFAMGMGSPLPERMSLLVMVLLCLGLGVPALLAVAGIAAVVGRRRHWQRLVNHQ